jgi:hypothetical protein
MKNVHVLPTDKPSRLIIYSTLLNEFRLLDAPIDDWMHKRNIYITSDEELPYDSSIFDSGAFYHRDPVGDIHIITKHTFKPNPHFCKRIILTTDQDLIKDGVQAIEDEFLEWFVKNPSCDKVEIESLSIRDGKLGYLIRKPQEEPEISDEAKERAKNYMALKGALDVKEETLEELGLYDETEHLLSTQANKERLLEDVKEETQRRYSEEDVREAFRQGETNVVYSEKYGLEYRLSESKWLEQFKKK